MLLVFLKAFLWIFFILGLVIFIHEFGHFIVSKLIGIRVEEFAFGYGKKIIGKKIGHTNYRINMIPYGGYVKLFGEEKGSDRPYSFSSKSIKMKSLVIIAGVLMNFILAVILFYFVLFFKSYNIFIPRISNYNFIGGDVYIQNKPIVENIIEDTPAAKVNFPRDVVIWSVDGNEIADVEEFVDYLSNHKNSEIKIKILSFEGQWKDISVIPSETGEEGVLLGVEFYDVIASFYKLDYSNTKIFSGLSHTINFTGYTLDVFKDLIMISFKEKSITPVSEGVSSPVGVANRIFELVRAGDIIEIFNLAAGVNLSLAIINLVPIPGLDGGYLIFLLLEKVRGKKIAEKYQEWATKIGFVFLITLGILVTIKDFIQFDILPRFGNLIKNLF